MTKESLYYPHQYSPIKLAWKLSFPVLISYFSVSLVFGILFHRLHQPWYYAPLMSMFVYACAVQFIALSIMMLHGSYWLILFSTIFVAFRNSFYGLSLLERFNYPKFLKAYMIFSLVDANYAIMAHHPPYQDKQQDKLFCFYLALMMHIAWILGALTSVLLSHHAAQLNGLEFILLAYFAIMVFENYLKYRSFIPVLVGSIAACIAFMIAPLGMMLFIAIIIAFMMQSLLYVKGRRI